MRKILVIEDEAPIRESLIDMLEFADYEVFEADNGHDGVELAQSVQPDLIICDVMMPVMDGYQTLLALRNHPPTATTPFIFLTAKASKADFRHGMDLGADDYIPKPFTAQELLTAVKARLEKHDSTIDQLRQQTGTDYFYSATLPHELRTPLSVILGYADILKEDHQDMDPDAVSQMLGSITKASERLYRLTENYITYTQLELLKQQPAKIEKLHQFSECHSVAGIMSMTVEQVSERFKRQSDVNLTYGDDVAVRIESDYLKKAIQELVDNAFKFSPADTPVEIMSATHNHEFVLTVTNEGRGMTAEEVAQIGPFVQFDRERYEQQGLGLGLCITRDICDLFGGKLMIESTPGRYLRAGISFPLA